MAITVTDRATFETAEGGAITMTCTSASFSCAAGAILSLSIGATGHNNTGSNNTLSVAVSDTIGDSGGGTWGSRATCTRGTVTNGQYAEDAQIWTRVIGTTPGASKAVTITVTWTTGGSGTTDDGWIAGHLYELAGQSASPIGLTASPSPVINSTTFNTDFGGVPASDSLCVSIGFDDSGAGTALTQPSGWTQDDDKHPAAGCYSWAHNTGSVQSPQWSGFFGSSGIRDLGCSVEILAASSSLDVPILHVPTQANVYRM